MGVTYFGTLLADSVGMPWLADPKLRRYEPKDRRVCTLETFIKRHAGSQLSNNGMHNTMQKKICAAPHLYGAPSRRTHMYREVAIEGYDSLLTSVDVVGILRGECYLWGVVTGAPERITGKEECRQLDEAKTFLAKRFKITPHLFLAWWEDMEIKHWPVPEAGAWYKP